MTTPFRGGFRNDGDADSGLDHAAYRVEAANANPHLHRHPEPCGVTGDVKLQRTIAREANKGFRDYVAESDLPTFSHLITARHDEHKAVRSKRKFLQCIRQDSIGRYADITGP